jgi:hypothetical protein
LTFDYARYECVEREASNATLSSITPQPTLSRDILTFVRRPTMARYSSDGSVIALAHDTFGRYFTASIG